MSFCVKHLSDESQRKICNKIIREHGEEALKEVYETLMSSPLENEDGLAIGDAMVSEDNLNSKKTVNAPNKLFNVIKGYIDLAISEAPEKVSPAMEEYYIYCYMRDLANLIDDYNSKC